MSEYIYKLLRKIKEGLLNVNDLIGDIDMVINYVDGVNDSQVISVTHETRDNNPDYTMDEDGSFVPPPGVDPDYFMNEIILQLENKKIESTRLLEWPGAASVIGGVEKGVDDATPVALLEGSITKRKDGRWMGQYYDHGTKKTCYAHSKLDVVNKVNDCIRLRNQNEEAERRGVAKKATLAEFIDVWYNEWIDGKSRSKPLSAATVANVQSTLLLYIKNHKLAKKPMSRITPDDLDKMFDSIPTKSMQARTFDYLSQVFDRAYKRKIIKDNTMLLIDKRVRPQADKKSMPSIELWFEFLDFVKSQAPDVYYISALATWTGMRLGEILALTWSDINIQNKWIAVSKSLDTHTLVIQDHPKTEAGFRNVPIFKDLFELLEELPKKKNAPVFWMCSSWSISKKVINWMGRFGKLPRMTFHSIRHLFASICHSAGVDKKTYSKWMGHANFGITQDLYTHVLSDFELEQVALMAKNSRYKK